MDIRICVYLWKPEAFSTTVVVSKCYAMAGYRVLWRNRNVGPSLNRLLLQIRRVTFYFSFAVDMIIELTRNNGYKIRNVLCWLQNAFFSLI